MINFNPEIVAAAGNGSVGPLDVSRGLITPGRPITITTSVSNTGPAALTRSAELAIDGQPVPGTAQVVGPLPPGGEMPVSFRTSIADPGSHAVAVRLSGEPDAMADDDESSLAIDVAASLPVLLIDGEPSAEPLTSETDFLRAALAPGGLDAAPVLARVVRADAFGANDLKGRRVAVLANVERLLPDQISAARAVPQSGRRRSRRPGRQGRRVVRQRLVVLQRSGLAAGPVGRGQGRR